MSAPVIVALEGVRGVGKTTHADHLALALRRAGVYSLPWHHPTPPDRCRTPYSRAQHYALARSEFIENEACPASHAEPPPVWIVDRWMWSTIVEAECCASSADGEAMRRLVDAEATARDHVLLTILLTAPLVEIERRLVARGESTAGMCEVHGEYLRLAEMHGWPAVATTPPREHVTARIVDIVRGWL